MITLSSKSHAFLRLINDLLEHHGFSHMQTAELQSPVRNWIVNVMTACTVHQFNDTGREEEGSKLIRLIEEEHSCHLEVPSHFNADSTDLFKEITQSFLYVPEGVPEFPLYHAKMVVALIQLNTSTAEQPPSSL
jgi:hypothetical protein